jgi:hypothetical protein
MVSMENWRKIIFPGVLLLLLLLPVAVTACELPDLVVTGVSFSPACPQAGDTVLMTATVMNQGPVAKPQGPYMRVLFLVDGEQINYCGTTGAINPGECVEITGDYAGPDEVQYWTATAGIHTVEACADSLYLVDECDECNNNYVTELVVGGGDLQCGGSSSGRQYNLHGIPPLGDGAFREIDALCQFTPYLEVQVHYDGHLNDVSAVYERDGDLDERITYGCSGAYGMHLVNPSGRIHIQAQKWNGDRFNGKPIRVTVSNCYGHVLYDGQSPNGVFDVYLAMKGCTAEEFAAWMAVNGPQE